MTSALGPRNAAPWRDVPAELLSAWQRVFERSRESVDLAAACPVCGERALHRWYQVGRPKDVLLGRERYVAGGGLWEWCSGCRAYAHYSALVPAWWSSDLAVDEAALTATPDALEQARLEAANRQGRG